VVAAGVLAVVLVVGVVVLAWPGHDPAPVAPVTSGPAQPWQRTDLRPVTQPVPAANDSRFLVYVAAAGKLRLTSLFSASGATAWTHNASTSVIAPGVAPVITLVAGAVIYLEPMAVPGGAQLVAAAADTGRILWRSGPGFFTSWPAVCADDTGWVCTTGNLASAGGANTLRFDARTGQIGAGVAMAADGGRELAPGLYGSQQRNPELLIAAVGGRISWQRPIDEVFPVRGASTDYGWTFNVIRHEGLFVGSVGGPPRRLAGGKTGFDLSSTATVALRAADGTVVWRDKGSYYLCNQLPCAGGVQDTGPSTSGSVTAAGTRIGLRLRATGVLGWSSRRQQPTLSKGARGQLEGFSPSTGRTLWTFDATRDHSLLTLQPPLLGPGGTVAVRNAAGREVLLDPETGRTTAVGAHQVLACSVPTLYRTTVGYRTSTGVVHKHAGSPAVFPCTGQAIRTNGPPPGAASVLVGNSRLGAWGDTTGVYAAAVPSDDVAG
jgi:outer membrane protein assembly factor BamB